VEELPPVLHSIAAFEFYVSAINHSVADHSLFAAAFSFEHFLELVDDRNICVPESLLLCIRFLCSGMILSNDNFGKFSN
jgi:CRISPR/Cas system-associated endonuclease Cas3-HD